MLKIGVLVSGGGTNLQAILDAIDAGEITNAKVDIVISNNASAYALERARKHDIEAVCIAPKDYPDREAFIRHYWRSFRKRGRPDCSCRISGCDPSDDGGSVSQQDHQYPSISDPVFLRKRFYGLKVHDAVLAEE